MIVNFSIQNFGSVKDKQTLSFEATASTSLEKHYIIEPIKGLRLLKLALIYGANASGKTTILNALEFLRDIVLEPAEKKTETLKFEPFLFDKMTPSLNSTLSIDFIQKGIRYYYKVEFNKKAIIAEELIFYSPNKAKVFSRKTDLENQFTEITFGSKIKTDKTFEKNLEANTLWNNTVLGGFLKTNIELPELKNATSWFSDYLRPLIRTGTKLEAYVTSQISSSEIEKTDVVQILRKADFNISDIIIQEDEEDIPSGFIELLQNRMNAPSEELEKLKNRGKVTSLTLELEHTINDFKYNLPFALESQGTKRYYGFSGILTLLLKKSVLFPIDELESSLHPDLFIHFILSFLINSKESQILATTHNREILDNKDIFRNDAIWFTDKDQFSSTELYSLSDFDSKVIRDTSNVYNAYKIGKLGGVPNLGDYYIDITDEKK
jgi:AAA15 family ATPase/GTPase